MSSAFSYHIKDISLAPEGEKKIEWVKAHMPVLNRLKKIFEDDKPLKGYTVAMCLHLEAKTAFLARVIHSWGAKVVMCASNPLSTQDDVVAALVKKGISVFAIRGSSEQDYINYLHMVLDQEPDLLIDDGGDLTALLHGDRLEQAERIIGGCEETTTGIRRLCALEKEGLLKFPMIAVNNAQCKYLFDNRYGTGQSVWDAINSVTNLIVAGKTVVVIGYGWCGKGVALRAKGLGARVIVCEVDPIRANEALMDGYEVMKLSDAAPKGDYFITVTGNIGVIREEHYKKMKNGAILANAGHFDVEIDKNDLDKISVSKRIVKEGIEEYTLANGNKIYLLGEGRLVNLACGNGHPAEIMDMSFALQAMSIKFLVENKKIGPGVHPVPYEIDREVAKIRLQALGIEIDTMDRKQKDYMESW
ncbi:MAG TPA: adenosylhomocysteinase [Peptococcaceae bacterium]|nr:MAG: Adenosylhomocysteinase [Clostridia bacterium 41_269]HBT19991.1 adenosylhomocysteinase [Peptococcaceae bacterium]